MNNASNTCIPKGRIKNIIPEIPTEAAQKIKERDDIRANTPESPLIAELNLQIEDSISKHKKEKWKAAVENTKQNSGKLFKLIKNLNGKTSAKSNQNIKFKGKYVSNPTQLANKFNKQYSSVVDHKSSKDSRKITRQMKANKTQAPQT